MGLVNTVHNLVYLDKNTYLHSTYILTGETENT